MRKFPSTFQLKKRKKKIIIFNKEVKEDKDKKDIYLFFAAYNVPDVGEVMLASFTESPDLFKDSISPSNPW